MKPLRILELLAGATVLITRPSLADDTTACLDAVGKAQDLRDMHRLVEAREEFRTCAAAGCPAVVRRDCATWLTEVESALPTVVISVKTDTGADLIDVKVVVDGRPLVTKLDGLAVALNPGPHTFRFEGADGAVLEQQVLVKEGQKSQLVAVVLEAPEAKQGAGSDSGTGSVPWKTIGWVAGGVGVAGLAMGTVFGLVAMSEKTSAHCGADNLCDPGTSSGIKRAALLSDVGWIAGGVLLATGATLVLLAPRGNPQTATSVKVAPTAAPGGGGVLLGGSF